MPSCHMRSICNANSPYHADTIFMSCFMHGIVMSCYVMSLNNNLRSLIGDFPLFRIRIWHRFFWLWRRYFRQSDQTAEIVLRKHGKIARWSGSTWSFSRSERRFKFRCFKFCVCGLCVKLGIQSGKVLCSTFMIFLWFVCGARGSERKSILSAACVYCPNSQIT